MYPPIVIESDDMRTLMIFTVNCSSYSHEGDLFVKLNMENKAFKLPNARFVQAPTGRVPEIRINAPLLCDEFRR